MNFKSEDDAKNYAVKVTTRYFSEDEAIERIKMLRGFLEKTSLETNKHHCKAQIEELEAWIKSEQFTSGDYSQGLDELLVELIEWRASIYAFQNVKIDENPFRKHIFHAQWLTGGIYAVFCLIGKLVSKNNRDNSLRILWESVSSYVGNSGLCDGKEMKLINERMHRENGHFTNDNSKAILFRNKVIAHNERMPRIEWDEVDKDIELLSRVWSLITMWSSFGLHEPFRTKEQSFTGLENVYQPSDIVLLQKKRDEFLDKVKSWCICSLYDGHQYEKNSPFGGINISFNVTYSTNKKA